MNNSNIIDRQNFDNGITATAFQKASKITITYVSAETMFSDNGSEDLYKTLTNHWIQFDQAEEFFKKVIARTKDRSRVTFTGHGLGGSIAQYMAVVSSFEPEIEITHTKSGREIKKIKGTKFTPCQCITWNAVGMKEQGKIDDVDFKNILINLGYEDTAEEKSTQFVELLATMGLLDDQGVVSTSYDEFEFLDNIIDDFDERFPDNTLNIEEEFRKILKKGKYFAQSDKFENLIMNYVNANDKLGNWLEHVGTKKVVGEAPTVAPVALTENAHTVQELSDPEILKFNQFDTISPFIDKRGALNDKVNLGYVRNIIKDLINKHSYITPAMLSTWNREQMDNVAIRTEIISALDQGISAEKLKLGNDVKVRLEELDEHQLKRMWRWKKTEDQVFFVVGDKVENDVEGFYDTQAQEDTIVSGEEEVEITVDEVVEEEAAAEPVEEETRIYDFPLASVVVEGIDYIKLLDLSMDKAFDEHTKVEFKIMISTESVADYFDLTETDITIKGTNLSGEKIFFAGVIDSVKADYKNDVSYCTMTGISHSYKNKLERKSRTYQGEELTYQEIFDDINNRSDAGTVITLLNTDFGGEATGGLIVQYNENDWDFLKRLASIKKLPIIIDDCNPDSYVWIGFRERDHVELKGKEYSFSKKLNEVNEYENEYILESKEILNLGDDVIVFERELTVKAIKIRTKSQVLMAEYTLVDDTAYESAPIKNNKIAGNSLKATVLTVDGDPDNKGRIQVTFEIDEDEAIIGEQAWFPYCVPYAGGEEGTFCLPEIDEKVLVHFPDFDEKKALVLSTVRETGNSRFSDVTNKIFRTTFGKEVTFSQQDIKIIGNDESGSESMITVSDSLTEIKNGSNFIKINGDMISALHGSGEITMDSQGIKLQFGSSAINITNTGITLEANGSSIALDGNATIQGAMINLN